MEFAYGADGLERYDVHLDCFAAWDLERTNHRRTVPRHLELETGGDLDSAVEDDRVWMTCTCGAVLVRTFG